MVTERVGHDRTATVSILRVSESAIVVTVGFKVQISGCNQSRRIYLKLKAVFHFWGFPLFPQIFILNFHSKEKLNPLKDSTCFSRKIHW